MTKTLFTQVRVLDGSGAADVNFLVGANDLKSARAELSRGVLDRLQAVLGCSW